MEREVTRWSDKPPLYTLGCGHIPNGRGHLAYKQPPFSRSVARVCLHFDVSCCPVDVKSPEDWSFQARVYTVKVRHGLADRCNDSLACMSKGRMHKRLQVEMPSSLELWSSKKRSGHVQMDDFRVGGSALKPCAYSPGRRTKRVIMVPLFTLGVSNQDPR